MKLGYEAIERKELEPNNQDQAFWIRKLGKL